MYCLVEIYGTKSTSKLFFIKISGDRCTIDHINIVLLDASCPHRSTVKRVDNVKRKFHPGPAERSRKRGGRGRIFLGGGQLATLPLAKGLGEQCKLPVWGPGRSPAEINFRCVSDPVESI